VLPSVSYTIAGLTALEEVICLTRDFGVLKLGSIGHYEEELEQMVRSINGRIAEYSYARSPSQEQKVLQNIQSRPNLHVQLYLLRHVTAGLVQQHNLHMEYNIVVN